MKVTMLLADAAQAVGGKLYILGGGWSITGPGPVPSAIAIKIEVPWNLATRPHQIALELLTADGQPVQLPVPPQGELQPIRLEGQFSTGIPPGLIAGTPIDATLALNIGPMPLPPGARYVWRLLIDGETQDEWQVAFSTQSVPALPPQQLPGSPGR